MIKKYIKNALVPLFFFFAGIVAYDLYRTIQYPKVDVTLQVEKCKAEAESTDFSAEYEKLKEAVLTSDPELEQYTEKDIWNMWELYKEEKIKETYKDCLNNLHGQ